MGKKLMVFTMGLALLLWSWPAWGANRNEAEGYLKAIYWDQESARLMVSMESYSGEFMEFPLDAKCNFTIDSLPAQREDFKAGLEILALIEGKTIVGLEAFSTAHPGYIAPGSRVKSGMIKSIDRKQISIKTDSGLDETYYLAPFTLSSKAGQAVPLSTLYEGDRVRLYFDEIDSYLVSRIEIEGNSVQVSNLYRGRLIAVNSLNSEVLLTDAEVFKNGAWQDYKNTFIMPYNYYLPVYMGGYQIPQNRLKYYRGKTVYLAGQNIMGRENAERMIVKNQSEYSLYGKVDSINWFAESLELDNHKNVSFNEGSLVLKNGRIQDQYALTPQADIYILADDWNGSRVASVIYILNENLNNSSLGRHYLLAGRLDLIVDDAVMLRDCFVLDSNEWRSGSEEKELNYDNTTSIFDSEEKRMISSSELLAGNYAVDEKSPHAIDKGLKDWYGYLYTDGDKITAMFLQPDMDSLLKQRVSAGTIATVENDPLLGWTILLEDSRDWSSYKKQWMPKSAALRLSLEKALLVKNGELIESSRLLPGDRLYLVRDDFAARVVIVK